jgi:hypothetical protein
MRLPRRLGDAIAGAALQHNPHGAFQIDLVADRDEQGVRPRLGTDDADDQLILVQQRRGAAPLGRRFFKGAQQPRFGAADGGQIE